MFKISPINDKKVQSSYASACGAVYREAFFAYSMNDAESGELMGFAQFEIDENGGFISDLKPRIGYDDFEAMFILGRATMNFIDTCEAHVCYASADTADLRLLKAIGFKENSNGNYECNMTGMFDGHCSGHAVKLEQ